MNDNDYTQAPQGKAELMTRIQREWEALERAIEQVSEAQMTLPDAGGWAIKDNLAHLAAWERFMRLYHLGNLPPHEVMAIDEATFEQAGEDGLNDILFQRSKNRPVADILAELHQSHRQVLADLEQRPFSDLMQPHYADDPEARPLLNWVIGNTYEHYREHRAIIERLIEQTKQ